MLEDMKAISAKYTVKDSVFTHLFGQKPYTLELYRALHPEDITVTADDIKLVTLENIMVNQPYNDLGFLVGNRLIVFVECQSTWSPNILVRLLVYTAYTLNQHLEKTKQNVYRSAKVVLPELEFYVIYLSGRGNKPEELSLSEEFYNGRATAIDLKAKIIYDSKQGDIINQYISFTKIYNEQVKLYGRSQQAVLETIKICKDRNIMRQYLEERESEVVNVMMTMFSAEKALEARILDARDEGYKVGEAYGEERGLVKGKTIGLKETALNMKKLGMSLDVIAKCVGVSEDTVRTWFAMA